MKCPQCGRELGNVLCRLRTSCFGMKKTWKKTNSTRGLHHILERHFSLKSESSNWRTWCTKTTQKDIGAFALTVKGNSSSLKSTWRNPRRSCYAKIAGFFISTKRILLGITNSWKFQRIKKLKNARSNFRSQLTLSSSKSANKLYDKLKIIVWTVE